MNSIKDLKLEAEKELERQREYFTETLIHDLKIPTLAQLRGLEVIRSETAGKLNNKQKELVSQIECSCRYILDMISMVLETYRFESGTKPLDYEIFSLSELLIECFAELESEAGEKMVEFVYTASEKDTIIEADRNDIKSLIFNLLSGAIIYSVRNEKIKVSIERTPDGMKTEIKSSGVLLSESECRTMFDKSHGTVPRYTAIGHGISLYLCKKITESHRGQIYATTENQKYNKVVFILPYRQCCANSSPAIFA